MLRLIRVVGVVAGLTGAWACSTDEQCPEDTIDQAVRYLKAHQSCETDADCVIVSDYCETLPSGTCGQLIVSRDGAASADWKSLDARLRACAPGDCIVCNAAVIPACSNGSCSPY